MVNSGQLSAILIMSMFEINLHRLFFGFFGCACSFELKVPLCYETTDKIWCYNEMAGSAKDMEDLPKARGFAKRAYDMAQESGDEGWKINTSLLMASLAGRSGQKIRTKK